MGVAAGNIVVEAFAHAGQETVGGSRWAIWSRRGSRWLRWEVGRANALAPSQIDASFPILRGAQIGRCYRGARLTYADSLTQGAPQLDSVAYSTSSVVLLDSLSRRLRWHVPDHVAGRSQVRFRICLLMQTTPAPRVIQYAEDTTLGTSTDGLTFVDWTPENKFSGVLMGFTEWIDLSPNTRQVWVRGKTSDAVRIAGIDFIDLAEEAEPDAVFRPSGSPVGNPRQASLMYDGRGGDVEKVIGNFEGGAYTELSAHSVSAIELAVFWGTTSDTTSSASRSIGGVAHGGIKGGAHALFINDDLQTPFKLEWHGQRRQTSQFQITLSDWDCFQNSDGAGTQLGVMNGWFRFDAEGVEVKQLITTLADARVWLWYRNMLTLPADVTWARSATDRTVFDLLAAEDNASLSHTGYTWPWIEVGGGMNGLRHRLVDHGPAWTPESVYLQDKTHDIWSKFYVLHYTRADAEFVTIPSGTTFGNHFSILTGEDAPYRFPADQPRPMLYRPGTTRDVHQWMAP